MTPSNAEPLDDYEEFVACFITTMKGVTWERAWSQRVMGKVGRQAAPFLSKECLIENKLATGRDRDYLDLKGIGAEFKNPGS